MSKGYDELGTEVLKKTLNFIAKPLADLINMSFSDGVCPDNLKKQVQPGCVYVGVNWCSSM